MFSSLASFLFGSNTFSTTSSETNHNPIGEPQEQNEQSGDAYERIDAENTIEVTSSNPSIVCRDNKSDSNVPRPKSGKNKRGKNNKNKKGKKQTPIITKLLTSNESSNEEIDEDDWFIVEKEDEENNSPPRTDSEEELPIVEVKPQSPARQQEQEQAQTQVVQRPRQYIQSHSLYSGSRQQQQQQQRLRQRSARNNGAHNSGTLNVTRLSPPRSIGTGGGSVPTVTPSNYIASQLADVGLTQSLYVMPHRERDGQSGSDSESGANMMEESWFVTPPPCFTSIGPINIEISPYENLLIEHPSMSVYHSIRSAQEATESFVDLDLGVQESQQPAYTQDVVPIQHNEERNVGHIVRNTRAGRIELVAQNAANDGAMQQRINMRIERIHATQLKQELFARNVQKARDIVERQKLCRSAIDRSNKVRDFQSKANRQRRSDMQHCKIVSRVSNDRKSCYH